MTAKRTGARRARRRHFAAVQDHVVISSCVSARDYRYTTLHRGLGGTFATFHLTAAAAHFAKQFWVESAPVKEIREVLVTRRPLMPGTAIVLTRDEVIPIDGTDKPRAHQVEELERLWDGAR